MIQEYNRDGLRLFYDEGTPHVWKMDDNERVERWRFYSDSYNYGIDAVKYSYMDHYEITYYRIKKDGGHYTLKNSWRATTPEVIADLVLNNPGLHFSEAYKEHKNRLNNA